MLSINIDRHQQMCRPTSLIKIKANQVETIEKNE